MFLVKIPDKNIFNYSGIEKHFRAEIQNQTPNLKANEVKNQSCETSKSGLSGLQISSSHSHTNLPNKNTRNATVISVISGFLPPIHQKFSMVVIIARTNIMENSLLSFCINDDKDILQRINNTGFYCVTQIYMSNEVEKNGCR